MFTDLDKLLASFLYAAVEERRELIQACAWRITEFYPALHQCRLAKFDLAKCLKI